MRDLGLDYCLMPDGERKSTRNVKGDSTFVFEGEGHPTSHSGIDLPSKAGISPFRFHYLHVRSCSSRNVSQQARAQLAGKNRERQEQEHARKKRGYSTSQARVQRRSNRRPRQR